MYVRAISLYLCWIMKHIVHLSCNTFIGIKLLEHVFLQLTLGDTQLCRVYILEKALFYKSSTK